MPQDAFDDLRVVDERRNDLSNGAHLAMTLRTQQRIDLPDFHDQA